MRSALGKESEPFTSHVSRFTPDVNSQAGQKSFAEKKVIYKKNFLRMYAEILKCADWDKAAIDERGERLLECAKNTWHDYSSKERGCATFLSVSGDFA